MKNYLFQSGDFYGASSLIFGPNKRPICLRATWCHGLGFALKKNYDKRFVLHYNETHLPIHLVNNTETADNLANQNINAIAVGMPYVYAKNYNSKKNNTSFKRIYFPRHSIGNNQESVYLRWKKIISKYNCDAISLTHIDYFDLKKSKYNLGDVNVILGAKVDDPDSLERTASILTSTKELITDNSSSHLVYAGASGAKVRIIDEVIANYQPNASSEGYKSIPKKFSEEYKKFYTAPKKSLEALMSSVYSTGNDILIKEYSEYLLGISSRKSIDKMKEYLTPISFYENIRILSMLLSNKLMRKIGI